MMTNTENQPQEYFLAFDSSCFTCSHIAQQIESLSNGRLSAKSLRDPQIAKWRADALGDNAPWEPTLVRVTSKGVQAWIGRSMNWRMLRLLGPADALRVVRTLSRQEAGSVNTVADPSRRRALRRLAGYAGAVALLATGSVPKSILASSEGRAGRARSLTTPSEDERWEHLFGVPAPERTELLEGSSADIVGQQLADTRPGQRAMALVQDKVEAFTELQDAIVGKHIFSDGNVLQAASWTINETYVIWSYQFDWPTKFETLSFVWEVHDDTATLLGRFSNHTLESEDRGLAGVGGPGGGGGDPDPPCDGCSFGCICVGPGAPRCCSVCGDLSISCAISACAGCYWACITGPWSCVACLGVVCTIAIYNCCESDWDCVPC